MKPSGITGVLRDGNLRINTEMSGTIKDHDKLESFMNSVNNSVENSITSKQNRFKSAMEQVDKISDIGNSQIKFL